MFKADRRDDEVTVAADTLGEAGVDVCCDLLSKLLFGLEDLDDREEVKESLTRKHLFSTNAKAREVTSV